MFEYKPFIYCESSIRVRICFELAPHDQSINELVVIYNAIDVDAISHGDSVTFSINTNWKEKLKQIFRFSCCWFFSFYSVSFFLSTICDYKFVYSVRHGMILNHDQDHFQSIFPFTKIFSPFKILHTKKKYISCCFFCEIKMNSVYNNHSNKLKKKNNNSHLLKLVANEFQ